MSSTGQNRRQFLKGGAALAGLALAGARSVSAAENIPLPWNSTDDMDLTWGKNPDPFWPADSEYSEGGTRNLADQQGILTPSNKHFRANHRSATPNINIRNHRFMVHGMVDRPLVFTMDDLKRLPSVSRVHYVACAGQSYLGLGSRLNAKTVQQTHGLTGCSEWTGVLLSTVLDMAGVQTGGNWLSAESVDAKKHAMTIPLEIGMRDVMLAWGQNGGPVRPELGYPLKLVVPGSEGTRNIKWLRRIKVVDQPQMTNYEIKCYANWQKADGKGRWFQFEMEPGGVILTPSGEQQLHGAGFYEISGIAWSGGGYVRRVEVSLDGGKSWKDAQLQEPIHRKAHTRFRYGWNWDGKEAALMSRTTDENGDIQPTLAELTKIWRVTPQYWLESSNRIQHFNGIQPWRVGLDGHVTNGMFHSSNNV
jgi:sulfane dehydrogenase subunit SoxC